MKQLRHVGTLSGLGTVAGAAATIQARYHIEIYQEWMDASSLEGTAWQPGLKQLEASIEAIPDALGLELGKHYTLTLQDGRRCEFWIKGMQLPGSHCDIVITKMEGI